MRLVEVTPRHFDDIRGIWRKLIDVLNGGISLDNWSGRVIVVDDTGPANTEFTVTHNLKKVPIGFLVTRIDKAGEVYDSGTTWTTKDVFLKCSAANAALTLLVFY